MRNPKTGILLMAYGSPSTEGDIEAYFTHIRGGRPPSPEALRELTHRYRAIGHSPLTHITAGQAAALSERIGLPTFIGMKHAKPFIAEGAGKAEREGIERLVGLPLAPHYADMSVGAYERELRRAWARELIFIRGFHDHPAFIDGVAAALALQVLRSRPERIFFTAHSLPARIVAEGDGYLDRLLESCRLVAAAIELPEWEFAFQSASSTGEPWLGPDLLTAIRRSGAHDVLVCPIGFVSDHLEILYDLDVEAQQFARQLGIRLRRTESFNQSPAFIEALAVIVRDALGGPQAAGFRPQQSPQSL